MHALFNFNIVLELKSLETHPILSSFSSFKRFIHSIHMQNSFRGNFPFFSPSPPFPYPLSPIPLLLYPPFPLSLFLSSFSSLPLPLSLSLPPSSSLPRPTLISRMKLCLVPIALCCFRISISVYSKLLLWENAKVIATSDRFERNVANKNCLSQSVLA